MGALANWADRFWERTRLACWRRRFAFANFLGRLQSTHINEPKEKFVSAERRNQHSARVRSPEDCCDGRLSTYWRCHGCVTF